MFLPLSLSHFFCMYILDSTKLKFYIRQHVRDVSSWCVSGASRHARAIPRNPRSSIARSLVGARRGSVCATRHVVKIANSAFVGSRAGSRFAEGSRTLVINYRCARDTFRTVGQPRTHPSCHATSVGRKLAIRTADSFRVIFYRFAHRTFLIGTSILRASFRFGRRIWALYHRYREFQRIALIMIAVISRGVRIVARKRRDRSVARQFELTPWRLIINGLVVNVPELAPTSRRSAARAQAVGPRDALINK